MRIAARSSKSSRPGALFQSAGHICKSEHDPSAMAGDMLSTLKKISTIFFKGTVLEAMKQTEEIFHHGYG
jgi:hypothetical protein